MIANSLELANNALPPKINTLKTYGYLDIIPTALIFANNFTQNVALKINFWGIITPFYFQIGSALHFDIVAPNSIFKQYLIDTRISTVEVVDTRNYKCIAVAFINWPSILRSISDQTLQLPPKEIRQAEQDIKNGFYLPFFDEEVQMNLDLLQFRQKQSLQRAKLGKTNDRLKVGEIKLQINSKIFAKADEQRLLHRQSRNNEYRFNSNEVEDNFKKGNNYPIPKVNIEINNEQQHNLTVNQSFITNKSSGKAVNGKNFSRKSGISIFDMGKERERRLAKVREQDSNKQLPSMVERSSNRRQNLDLQLMRVRMEMEELVGLTQKQKIVTINIKCFESLNKLQGNKPLPFIEVTCLNTNARFRIYAKETPNPNPNKVDFDSALAFSKDSRLQFVGNLKKPSKERVVKGQLNINALSQSHQLHLVTAEGILEGILHINKLEIDLKKHESASKQQSKHQEQLIKRERGQIVQNQKKHNKEIFSNNNAQLKFAAFDEKMIIQQLPRKRQKQKNYYILVVKQKKEDLAISYKVINKSIPPTAKHKFVILQQDQVQGKQLTISIHRNGSFLQQHTIAHLNEQIPIISSNITCQLIKQQYLSSLQAIYQLYAGSLPQINYFVIQLTNSPTYQNTKPHHPEHNFKDFATSNKQSQGEGRLKERDIDEIQNKQRIQLRKLKTQQLNVEDYRKKEQKDRRITTEGRISGGESLTAGELMTHNQEHELNPSEPDHNDNIYLVDLMTRFLQSLSINTLETSGAISLQQFVELSFKQDGILQKNSQFKQQKELIQLVVSIFLQDPESPVDVLALKQSQLAYSTFKDLYNKEVQELMREIKKQEPTAFESIRLHSQLGMINEHILWNRSLPKVTNYHIRQRISKFYRISHYGPTDGQFLLKDLQGKGKAELRELDISNLGILIRESVQKYLANTELVTANVVVAALAQHAIDQTWINIRGLNLLFESLFRLKISLWESLMLIQEIKVCYGCDLQAEQGIISTSAVVQWVATVQNRSFANQKSTNSSKVSQKPHYKVINENNRYSIEVEEKSRNQSYLNKQNNDSQIFDIANLLRKREEELQMQDYPYDVQKSAKQSSLLDAIHQNQGKKNAQKAPVLLHQSSEDQLSQEQLLAQKINSKPRIIGVKIQQIKFYEEFQDPKRVKIQIGIEPNTLKDNQNSYFYLSHFDQKQGHCSTLFIDSAARPTIWIKTFDKAELKGRLGIVWEQYCQCFNKNTVNKTVVTHNSKGKIVGKAVLLLKEQLSKPQNQPKQQQKSKTQTCFLEVKLLKPFSIHNKDLLFIKVSEQVEQHQLSLKQTVKLKIREPIYYRQLQIQNENRRFGCIVPLQQLFLRRLLSATYPLITYLNCTFVGNASLAIRILTLQQYELHKRLDHQQKWWTSQQEQQKQQEQAIQIQRGRERREKPAVVQKKIQCVRSKNQTREQEDKDQVIKRIDNIYQQLKAKFSR